MTKNTLTFYAPTLDELKAKILAFQERNLEFIVTCVDYTGIQPSEFAYDAVRPYAIVTFSPYIATIKTLTDDTLRAYLGQRCAELLYMSAVHVHQWAVVNGDSWCYACGVRKIPVAALRRDDAVMCLCGHYDYRHLNGKDRCMGHDTSTNESYCPCTQFEAWTVRQAPRAAYVVLTSQDTQYTRMFGRPIRAGHETGHEAVYGSTAHEVLRKTAKVCGWRSETHVNSTGRIITDVYL